MVESQKYIQICRFAKFIPHAPFFPFSPFLQMAEGRQEINELQNTTFPISTLVKFVIYLQSGLSS